MTAPGADGPDEGTDPGVLVEASGPQRSMWLAEQLSSGQDGYVMPLLWQVRAGRIDPDQLRRGIGALTARHEILRTALVERDGRLWQRIGERWTPPLERADFAELRAEEQEAAWRAWARRIVRRPFDLGSGRLLRPGLADLGPAGQILLLSVHHTVCDGYSVAVLLDDLDALLGTKDAAGAAAEEAPRYRDFVQGQEQWSAGLEGRLSLDFWAERLRGAPSRLAFEPPAAAGGSDTVAVPLSAGLTERIRGLRREHGVSWFMVAAATLAALLHRWTGQDDVTFGCEVANRDDESFAAVVGPCTNSVVLRSRCGADATRDALLDSMREQVLGAVEHQQTPLEAVVDRLRPPRRLGHTPYRDVVFSMTTLAGRRPLGDCEIENLPAHTLGIEPNFGLAVTVSDVGGEPWVVLSYRGDRHSAERAQRLAADFADLLDWLGG